MARRIGIDQVTFEDYRLVSGSGDGKRSRKSRDAASGDDEPHSPKLSDARSVAKWRSSQRPRSRAAAGSNRTVNRGRLAP